MLLILEKDSKRKKVIMFEHITIKQKIADISAQMENYIKGEK